jgi:tetratricopeptide (TPR) repeat protein
MSIHGALELAPLLPLAAALAGDAPPPPDEAADLVAAALAGTPRFRELIASLTAVRGSACAKDAAGEMRASAAHLYASSRCCHPTRSSSDTDAPPVRSLTLCVRCPTVPHVAADAARARGATAFRRLAFAEAAAEYSDALRLAPGSDAPALAVLFTARASALQRTGAVAAAERDCDRAIELDKVRVGAAACALGTRVLRRIDVAWFVHQSYAKAWLRRGALRTAAGRATEGAADLKRAAALDPSCAAAAGAAGTAAPMRRPASGGARSERTPPPPPPELPAGGSLPHAAPGVVASDADSGERGLRTETARAAGDVLLVEPPFACVVLRGARGAACHACFRKLPPDAAPCAGCAAAHFCGAACAAAAVAPGGAHADECGGASWPAALPADAVLAARLVRRTDAASDASSAAAVAALRIRWSELSPEERLESALLAAIIAACVASHGTADGAGDNDSAADAAAEAAVDGDAADAGDVSTTIAEEEEEGAHDDAPVPFVPAAATLRVLLAVRAHAAAVRDEWEAASWAGGAREPVPVAAALYATASAVARVFAPSVSAAFSVGGVLVLSAVRELAAGAPLALPHASHPFDDASAPAAKPAKAAHAFACACAACVQPCSAAALQKQPREGAAAATAAAAVTAGALPPLRTSRSAGAAAAKASPRSSISTPPRPNSGGATPTKASPRSSMAVTPRASGSGSARTSPRSSTASLPRASSGSAADFGGAGGSTPASPRMSSSSAAAPRVSRVSSSGATAAAAAGGTPRAPRRSMLAPPPAEELTEEQLARMARLADAEKALAALLAGAGAGGAAAAVRVSVTAAPPVRVRRTSTTQGA